MPDALLTLLRWCLLALLYLFFFRVLQATWQGALAPAGPRRKKQAVSSAPTNTANTSTAPAPVAPRLASHLVIIEPAESAGQTFAINHGLTLGRAAGCEVTVDDTFVSQLHAKVFVGESGVVVEDLGSTNGTYVNRARVTAPVVVSPGDRVQVGNTVLELR